MNIKEPLIVGALLFLVFGMGWGSSLSFEEITPQFKASSYDARTCQYGIHAEYKQPVRCLFEDEVTHP